MEGKVNINMVGEAGFGGGLSNFSNALRGSGLDDKTIDTLSDLLGGGIEKATGIKPLEAETKEVAQASPVSTPNIDIPGTSSGGISISV